MAETQIEWTDATWNPVAGCSIISAGCTNCYAMEMAKRLEAMRMDKICRTDPAKRQAHRLERRRPGRSGFTRNPTSLEKIAQDFRQFDERPVS